MVRLARYKMNVLIALYTLFTGLIFAAGLPPKLFIGLEWIAFIPFLSLLLFNFKNRRNYFVVGFLAGFAAMGKYLIWLFKSAPLVWLGIKSIFWSYLLVGFIWFLAVFYFALWFGLFLYFIKFFETKSFWDIFLISFAWPVFEFLRIYFYSFYLPVIGQGGIIGNHMALGIFGYSLADYPILRQWAAFGGDYFLSFILILVNAAVFILLRFFKFAYWSDRSQTNSVSLPTGRQGSVAPTSIDLFNNVVRTPSLPSLKNKKSVRQNFGLFAAPTIFLFLIILLFLAGGKYFKNKYFKSEKEIQAAVIQLNFPVDVWSAQNKPQNVFSGTREILEKAIKSQPSPDLILIPEGADIPEFASRQTTSQDLKNLLGRDNYRVVINGSFSEPSSLENRTAVFDNEKGFLGVYAKQFLTPFGEYMPVIFKKIAMIFAKDWIESVQHRFYFSGRKMVVFETKWGKLAALLCSEIISPQIGKEAAQHGAQILTYAASDSIFRGSSALHAQNIAMAQIRAVETRRPLLYSSNGERSFIIDAFGKIIWEGRGLEKQIGLASVWLNSTMTPYVLFGNWFILISFIILLGITLSCFFGKWYNKNY